MKKIFSILLIFAILFSTVGITVAHSYCKMKKAEIEKQQCCKKKCKSNCCGKQIKVYKLSFDSLPTSFAKYLKVFSVNFHSPVFAATFSFNNNPGAKTTFPLRPPPLSHVFETSFTEVFRI